MATNTTNLGLIKPSSEDFYNIENFNENFQKIDDAFGEAPKTLIYGRQNVTTNDEIVSTLMGWFSQIENEQMKNFILYVATHDLTLPGGMWFVTICKVNSGYGTIFINKYTTATTEIRLCSIYDGTMGNWEKITPTGVVNASVE